MRQVGFTSTRRFRSEIDLLRDRQGVVHFDPQIPDGALKLSMPEQ
jgi:hypothetical protein